MRSNLAGRMIRWPILVFLIAGGFGPVQAAEGAAQNGAALLAMCKGADRVRTLGVMCHSYINGYADAASQYGGAKARFCIDVAERSRLPELVVEWLGAHPEGYKQPAAEVMHQVLSAHFSCRKP